MKVFVPITALIGLALAYDEGTQCSNKDPSVVNAIGKFCQNTKMVVPSSYATGGMAGYSGHKTHIRITGSCSPAQWVPQKYCLSQFYHMYVTLTHLLFYTPTDTVL